MREEQQASHGRGGRALLALLAGAQRLLFGGAWAALWRFLPRGGQPAVPEWHAVGRTEEDDLQVLPRPFFFLFFCLPLRSKRRAGNPARSCPEHSPPA